MSNEYLDLAGLTAYDTKLKDAIKTGKVLNIENGNYHSIIFYGCYSDGTNSFAEGYNTQSLGEYSHTEGSNTVTHESFAHAEGNVTQANGIGSHAEGNSSMAIGDYSHAEGYNTEATGAYSHAEGKGTIANLEAQTAIGQYNESVTNGLFVVGNGTSEDNRHNAFAVKSSTSGVSLVIGDTELSESTLGLITSVINTPEMHRNIYRGKNLGTSVTTAQLDAISNGTFDDIYVGDYWVINGTTYVIVDFDYYYGIGDISKMSKHHVVIVPKDISTFAAMNTTSSYKPYYYARNAISELATLRNTIKTDFGSTNVLTYENRFLDSNGTDGTPNSSATAIDASIELMNEIQIFGLNIVSPQKINSIKFYDNRQFAGFKLNPSLYLPNINTTDYTGYWTRDYANSSSYSAVMNYGYAEDWTANLQLGLRPYFLLGKSAS